MKRVGLTLLIFLGMAAVFFWTVRESWEKTPVSTDPVNRSAMAENVGDEIEAVQRLTVAADTLESIGFDLYVQDPAQDGGMTVRLLDGAGETLRTVSCRYGELIRDGMNDFVFAEPLTGYHGKDAILKIHTDGGIWIGYGSTVSAGKMDVRVETEEGLRIGEQILDGTLVMRQKGWRNLTAAARFWPAVGFLAGAFVLLVLVGALRQRRGHVSLMARIRDTFRRYQYLLRQLVMRDFKVKYKASMLGVVWSFLNPLLMTLVYFVVFSNLFSNQENFVVYLMTGTVLFNYVSESTSLGLNAIVGNAGLITKVYMPKYIYPLSKVLSSAINLLISMIPLMVLMALNGLRFTKALLLIPVLILLLILFCAGLSLLLSAFMVFFRDTQFLWSVLILMWNFLSPVFYPESIIPLAYRHIYRMNPLYQFMSFLRSITIGGTAPGPECFGICLLSAAVSMGIGLIVFRKLQRKFAIYL